MRLCQFYEEGKYGQLRRQYGKQPPQCCVWLSRHKHKFNIKTQTVNTIPFKERRGTDNLQTVAYWRIPIEEEELIHFINLTVFQWIYVIFGPQSACAHKYLDWLSALPQYCNLILVVLIDMMIKNKNKDLIFLD